MNKILLSVATTVAVVGGTALAASIPIHVSTTTYKPGTPASMTYKGSPDEVGQSSTGGTNTGTNTANTPASASTSASSTSASPTSSQMGPTQPAIPGSTTPKQNQTPIERVWDNLYQVPPSQVIVPYAQAVHGMSLNSYSFASGWMPADHQMAYLSPHVIAVDSASDWFNGVSFWVKPSWRVFQDSSNNVILNGQRGGVSVTVMPKSAFGSSWPQDRAHFYRFVNRLYAAPSGWIARPVNGYYFPQDNTGFFTLPNNQLIWVKSTAQGVYTVVYTKVHHSPLTLLPTT